MAKAKLKCSFRMNIYPQNRINQATIGIVPTLLTFAIAHVGSDSAGIGMCATSWHT